MAAKIRSQSNAERPLGSIYRRSDIFAWAKYWHCTQQEVRDAARVAGPMIVDIQDWITINVAH